jgi:histidyl-tRNA synthetase
VIGGGRYDGLIETLGGPHTPAVGWAAGIERLAMMIDAPAAEAPFVFVVPDGEGDREAVVAVANALRRAGVSADFAVHGKIKKQFELAKRSMAAARVVVAKSGESGLPDRIGLHIRVNQISTFERGPEKLRDVVLDALEKTFRVNRFEPMSGGWSPDAVLQKKIQ